jgi:hypothetical protein
MNKCLVEELLERSASASSVCQFEYQGKEERA